LWSQIVGLYSAANLTFGKDKLPAISGIARLGHKETGDQYLAGLWRGRIEEQLCWRRRGSKPTLRPTWRAPSWSWASVDGRVSWYPTQERVLETKYAHLLDASMIKYGHDPFGQVTSGVIRLACSTIAVGTLVRSEKSNEPESVEGIITMIHIANSKHEFPIQIDCLDDVYQEGNGTIHLLPILGGQTGNATGAEEKDCLWEFMIEGIVLRASGVTKGQFSRIGSFNFYKNRAFNYDKIGNRILEEEPYEPFLRVLEEHGTVTAEAACAEIISNPENHGERYVITLV